MKARFVTYADMESLLEKIDTCHDNPEKSSVTTVNKHTAAMVIHYLRIVHLRPLNIGIITIEARIVWKHSLKMQINYEKKTTNDTINKWGT